MTREELKAKVKIISEHHTPKELSRDRFINLLATIEATRIQTEVYKMAARGVPDDEIKAYANERARRAMIALGIEQ